MELTHLDHHNHPTMVDITSKNTTNREAVASGKIFMSKEAYYAITHQQIKKGPVIQTAIIAAIMASKKTSDLIPMCHPIALTSVHCEILENPKEHSFLVRVVAKTQGQTGVEMEALAAVSIGLLTIYDMAKAIDKSMIIQEICLEKKSGGKSGNYQKTN